MNRRASVTSCTSKRALRNLRTMWFTFYRMGGAQLVIGQLLKWLNVYRFCRVWVKCHYIYIYVCVYMYMYIHIYIYIGCAWWVFALNRCRI